MLSSVVAADRGRHGARFFCMPVSPYGGRMDVEPGREPGGGRAESLLSRMKHRRVPFLPKDLQLLRLVLLAYFIAGLYPLDWAASRLFGDGARGMWMPPVFMGWSLVILYFGV